MSRAPALPPALERRLEAPVETCREAVEEAAEIWGAAYESGSGELVLPLSAGISQGRLGGRLSLEPEGDATRLRFEPREQSFRLRWNVVVVLLFAAAGGAISVLWPVFPGLLPLAPLGIGLVLAAWFLVLSRLTTNGPEDFVGLIERILLAPSEQDEGGEETPAADADAAQTGEPLSPRE